MFIPQLINIKDASLKTKPQVFIQTHAQVGLTLWLVEIVEYSHLGLVISTLPDFGCTVPAQLAVARITVTHRSEPGIDPDRIRCGLAAVAPQYPGTLLWQIAVSHAARLSDI